MRRRCKGRAPTQLTSQYASPDRPSGVGNFQEELRMTTPTIAQKSPIAVDVEVGKSYWWCTCGNSKKQPFCDGTHKGGPFTPMEYKAESSAKVWLCACKQTSKKPLCDGTHKKL
jgi:CDGSH iron-sulfur domain-containing protein 3